MTREIAATQVESALDAPQEGFKETVESIVVALILAFVFRAFVVEAFIIPTGSMAPTLYGAHGTVVCEDCGWEFRYGLMDLSQNRGGQPVHPTSVARCPNCNHVNTNLAINDLARNAESGDRILVLKWPFDLGIDGLGPARWDVAVFKNPADGVENYIKRLVGLPNEVLMIIDGNVYRTPTDALSPETREALKRQCRLKYELRAGLRADDLPRLPESVFRELDEKLRIQRKTPPAQEALWFVVYDHDYPPRSLDADQPHWAPQPGAAAQWNTTARRIRFEPSSPDLLSYVTLNGKAILGNYAYNFYRGAGPRSPDYPPPAVVEQRVEFVLTPRDREGAVHVRVAQDESVFWASIHFDGRVTLTQSPAPPEPHAPPLRDTRIDPIAPGRLVEVAVENVDYRVSLSVGGVELLTTSDDPRDPAYFGPDVRALRKRFQPGSSRRTVQQPPRIYGRGGGFELTHVVVKRDVYYIRTDNPAPWCNLGGWGTVGNPILLREGEYFMLGDNSPASQDSRLWGDVSKNQYLMERGEEFQLGTVPRDQLIGKAFFVYWPAAHRITWLPLPPNWGIIPNVGRMRWIR